MERIVKAGIAGFLLLSCASGVCAQEKTIELEELIVTASRLQQSIGSTPRKVTVLNAQDLAKASTQDLAKPLSSIASVNIINYGGLGAAKSIEMRGSNANQVLVLVDGRPINSPRDGQVDLSTIPLENIEKIEVMHGPGASLYGAGAMGGTVNIITRNPPPEKTETELTTSFGTYRTYRKRLVHGGRIGNFGYLISGGYESSEGFRENSESRAKNFNAKFEYKLNPKNTVTLNSGFYRSLSGTPGPIDTPDNDDKQKNLKNFFDVTWNSNPDELTGLSAKIYQNYDRLEFMENSAGSMFDTAFAKDIHTTIVKGTDIQLARKFFDIYQALCGFNYVTNRNDSTTSAKRDYDVIAGYLENQIDILDNLKFELGGRLDDYSNFGAHASPHAGAVYTFNEHLTLRGSISRSFRAPTFNDLYWPDQGWVKGNPELKPEKGLTGEFGIELKANKNLSSNLTLYQSKYSELINWAEEAGVWEPTNINDATIRGIELENTLHITDNFETKLGYTYLDAKDDETHKYLIYKPKHKIDCSLTYKGSGGFMIEMRGNFTAKRFHNADNSIIAKKFFVLGLSASKKFGKNVTYFISMDNMLNKKYQVVREYPMPGFSLTSGIKLEF